MKSQNTKQSFFKKNIELAEEIFKEEKTPYFVDYLKAIQQRQRWELDGFTTSEIIGVLAAKKTREQADRFYNFLYNYCNFRPIFFDLIGRQIILNENLVFKDQEAQIKKEFCEHKITLETAVQKLHQTLLGDELPTTHNALGDIIEWLNSGDCVVFHNDFKDGLIYHTCDSEFETEGVKLEMQDFTEQLLTKTRVVYIDVARTSALLDESEWPYYLAQNQFTFCNCPLKGSIEKGTDLTNTYSLKL